MERDLYPRKWGLGPTVSLFIHDLALSYNTFRLRQMMLFLLILLFSIIAKSFNLLTWSQLITCFASLFDAYIPLSLLPSL